MVAGEIAAKHGDLQQGKWYASGEVQAGRLQLLNVFLLNFPHCLFSSLIVSNHGQLAAWRSAGSTPYRSSSMARMDQLEPRPDTTQSTKNPPQTEIWEATLPMRPGAMLGARPVAGHPVRLPHIATALARGRPGQRFRLARPSCEFQARGGEESRPSLPAGMIQSSSQARGDKINERAQLERYQAAPAVNEVHRNGGRLVFLQGHHKLAFAKRLLNLV